MFSTLVAGIAGGGDMKHMGRIGGKAILYFEIVTTLALFLGLAAVNWCGRASAYPSRRRRGDRRVPQAKTTAGTMVEHTFPISIADAMARNDALQIVVFAFLFGASCAAVGAKAAPVVTFCTSLAEVMFQFTRYVMSLAPIGVGAAIAVTVGTKGVGVLFGLGKLILTMYAASVICILLVLARHYPLSDPRRRASGARRASHF